MATHGADELLPYLRNWRAIKGMTQIDLAVAADVTVSTVSRIESGKPANILTAVKLARALGVSVNDLIANDPMTRPLE